MVFVVLQAGDAPLGPSSRGIGTLVGGNRETSNLVLERASEVCHLNGNCDRVYTSKAISYLNMSHGQDILLR